MDAADLEGVASWALGETGIGDPPVDAFDLVESLEMPLLFEPGTGGRRSLGRIIIGTNTPVRQLHSVIAHECAHELLDRCGLVNDEPSARYLGPALLVPYRALDRQLRAGWDLHRFMCVHLNASAELLARRIVDVRRDVGLAIYDSGRLRRRIGLAHRDERTLADQAFATGEPVRIDGCTGAWPVFTGQRRRVIVLSPAA